MFSDKLVNLKTGQDCPSSVLSIIILSEYRLLSGTFIWA